MRNGKACTWKPSWPPRKDFARHGVDFLHQRVGHGVAAGRLALAVDHQELAGAPVRAIIGVGVAQVHRQMVLGVRVHLLARDRVEALGRLAVALLDLGAELSRPVANGIGLEVVVAAVVALLPDLELGVFLEDADEDRRLRVHALLAEEHHGVLRQRTQVRRDDLEALAQDANARAAASGGSARQARQSSLPRMIRLIPSVPQVCADHQ